MSNLEKGGRGGGKGPGPGCDLEVERTGLPKHDGYVERQGGAVEKGRYQGWLPGFQLEQLYGERRNNSLR